MADLVVPGIVNAPTVSNQASYDSLVAAIRVQGGDGSYTNRWTADYLEQQIDNLLEGFCWPEIFAITDHELTVAADTSQYEAPSADCDRLLSVQLENTTTPYDLRQHPGHSFSRWLWHVGDGSLATHTNEKYLTITGGNVGSTYYLVCAHRPVPSTLNAAQQRMIILGATSLAMKYSEVARTNGPTNQADRTVKVSDQARLAAAYWADFEEIRNREAAHLRELFPSRQRFVRNP